jgi:hypothetical protein
VGDVFSVLSREDNVPRYKIPPLVETISTFGSNLSRNVRKSLWSETRS